MRLGFFANVRVAAGALALLATGTAVVLLVRVRGHEQAGAVLAPLPNPDVRDAPAKPGPFEAPPSLPAGPPLAGIDLTSIIVDDDGATAKATGERTAHLTVDPTLQRTAEELLARYHLPEAAAVLVDVAHGQVLAYANHVEEGDKHDVCASATAPAASVFKIVTATALVEGAGLGPDTKQCYCGGEQRLMPSDLTDDPARDRWCTTLAGAMGHSTNAVFARLALKNLKPTSLEAMAARLGWNGAAPIDVPAEPSTLHVPTDTLGFGRTAAGFWNSTLSPVQAAYLTTALAREGDATRLELVRSVTGPGGEVLFRAPASPAAHRLMSRETALAVTTMMETTVTEGTSYRAFHDKKGTSFLPGVPVAGKTGTLTDAESGRFYTWFTGFAPSRPMPGVRQVAIAVLVVNKPTWRVKANVIARELLREHFALQHVARVSRPLERGGGGRAPEVVARRDDDE